MKIKSYWLFVICYESGNLGAPHEYPRKKILWLPEKLKLRRFRAKRPTAPLISISQKRLGLVSSAQTLDGNHLIANACGLLDTIRIEANRRDVPYQSLIKMTLAEQFQN